MDDFENVNLGKLLRALRRERGWTQEKLAGLLGLSVAAVSQKERGATGIRPTELPQIAEVFGIDMRELARRAKPSSEAGIPVINRAPAGGIIDNTDPSA